MPVRKTPLVTDQIYHIFNRGLSGAPIFSGIKSYRRFMSCLMYYRFQKPPLKLSHFLVQSREDQYDILYKLSANDDKLVEIFCFCLMPNHFHLLIKQVADKGISNFMRVITNSYSSYFNLTKKRLGPLLQGIFKSVRIETDEQLLHVSRYIHINPLTGHIVLREKLTSFPWSSLPEYLRKESLSEEETSKYINKSIVLSHFTSVKGYKRFILDYADYKISQANFQHLFLE